MRCAVDRPLLWDEGMHLWTFNDADKAIRLCYYIDRAKRIHTAGLR